MFFHVVVAKWQPFNGAQNEMAHEHNRTNALKNQHFIPKGRSREREKDRKK